jgi:predicted nucleic acid-binding protein
MMDRAKRWFVCEITFVEAVRAIGLATGAPTLAFEREWPQFEVVPVDHQLSIRAAHIATAHKVRTLDSLQLAAAEVVVADDFVVATWDRQMRKACQQLGLSLDPLTPPN